MEFKKQTFLTTTCEHVVQFNMKNNQICPKLNLTKNIKNILYLINFTNFWYAKNILNHQRSWILQKLAKIEA